MQRSLLLPLALPALLTPLPPWFNGQVMAPVVNDEVSTVLFPIVTRPAGCGAEVVVDVVC